MTADTAAAPAVSSSTPTPSALDERYRAEHGTVQLTGLQALVRLPFDALRAEHRAGRATRVFISGYEGSPLAGYDLELQRHQDLIDETGLVFRPAVNEELAATAVQGSQLASQAEDKTVDGVVGFWYGKSPGLDRASDALRHANLMGTAPTGGAVALVGDDPSAKSSTVPGASEALLAELGMPVLYPADPQEALDLGLHAVAMSRTSGLWVGMKIATNVADGFGSVRLGTHTTLPDPPPEAVVDHVISAKLAQPVIGTLERSRETTRLEAARTYGIHHALNRIHRRRPGQRVGIVAAGKTYLDVRAALDRLGLTADSPEGSSLRLLQLRMVFPLDPAQIREFADGLDEVIVVEEKRAFIETAMKDALYASTHRPHISGKRDPAGTALFPVDGELDVDKVIAGLTRRLGARDDFPGVRSAGSATRPVPGPLRSLPLLARTPYFCSGCPHNSSTRVPTGSLVGAGIGCHAMVAMMDPSIVGDVTGLTQMGGEGAQWIGMQPFVDHDHLFQNLGDGTFHHSGSLAIRAAIAGEVNITYKLLYNSAVAMTGGQQAVGLMTVPQICRALLAEGVARIIVTTDDTKRYRRIRLPRGVDVMDRDRLDDAQRALAATAGVTVLIHDQECATELRRKRRRRLAPQPEKTVVINERVCEGCGDCGRKSNCLSVQPVPTEFGRKTAIDQSSCNRDYTCLDGDCPAFMTVTVPKAGTQPAAPSLRTETLDADAFKDPLPSSPRHAHAIRITGVGGTGVVTLAQTLGQAATLAGLSVRALDQTGLAQKGGAVVSDLRLSSHDEPAAHKLAAGECDLYLACDLLVGAGDAYLSVASPEHTTAVVSSSKVPTGSMVVDTAITFPDDTATIEKIRAATSPGGLFLDARSASETLLGDEQYANVLLAGIAYQKGAIPIPASSIEEALRLNGVKVDANLQAFRRGRQFVADPDAFAAAVGTAGSPDNVLSPRGRAIAARVHTTSGSELERLVDIRVGELISFQNAAYAQRYADLVELVRSAEEQATPGETGLAEAAAWSLHKLMAYKDEYEVARLLLGPAGTDAATGIVGPGAKVSYRLHPPMLRELGMKHKISLGPWSRPVLRALAASRRLRGTALDPFGRAHVRRVERELVAEFEAVLRELAATLTPANHAHAITIAQLPDMVRGYEQVKLHNVADYHRRLAELRGAAVAAVTA
ncbi:indolepyruvate ferredoxin oxidoreductase family protein [Gordonia sp. ABSL11-1]|uniref:indolepyruvate ferredoxin oxidoreductase family protein n=1 Tax=Gordonia sp. ABSL11-1 TaxID=3053924 RepID=UPI002573DF17|nr:indolepyruvate ferredoxin oxidoreductase family protein [Gordonia sp. ABSL11-1]MDL9948149.1 indolepyruvate ferredoxin oxidoreductase family protein [Gordonia sp. ABSL11-1]